VVAVDAFEDEISQYSTVHWWKFNSDDNGS